MVLVERREMIEIYLKEVVTTIDFEMYEPLDRFIDGTKNVQRLLEKLSIIKRFFRQKLAKKKLLSVSLLFTLLLFSSLSCFRGCIASTARS